MDKRAAAAIRYDDSLPAPFVVASGRAQAAERLLTVARRFGVPVMTAPELADRLIMVEPFQCIPEELYVPVAEILAFVLDMNEHVRYSEHNEKNSGQ